MGTVVNGSPTTDYLTFLLNQPNVTPEGLLSLFFLALFRIAPIVAIAPFLGAKLPGGVKIGLAIAITIIFLPQVMHTSPKTIFSFNLDYIGFSLKELIMGAMLAFFAAIPFYIAQGAGSLIDFMRGSSSLQVQDPFMQTQTSSIGILFNYVLIVIFFQIGGPFVFLDAVSESFRILPIDKMIPVGFFNLNLPFWKTVMGLMTRIFAISIQLAAPSIVSILMAEMFLGIANRLAPQVQIVFLGMSLKSLLGLGLLWTAWFFILQQMAKQSLLWVKNVDDVLRSLGM
jgi:type III secretion protein T